MPAVMIYVQHLLGIGHLKRAATLARALTADDAPAVGAAILPFSYRLLPTRFALLKTP